MTTAKPSVNVQGTVVVEDSVGGGKLFMFPDGQTGYASTIGEMNKQIKRWAEKHMDKTAINALRVEYR